MSLLGTWFGKFLGAMGGAPAAGAIVVGGLAVGIIVGVGTGSGGFGASPAPSIVVSEIYPCPNMGPPLMTIKSGQHVFVTGKLADGSWFRIQYGSGGRQEAWIPATAYQVLGSLDNVPDVSCAPEALFALVPSPGESDTPLGSFEPTPVPTVIVAVASPTPTPRAGSTPRATPRATARATPKPPPPPPPPDTTRPVLGRLSAKPNVFWMQTTCNPHSTTFNMTAVDPETGIARVTLHWSGIDPTGKPIPERLANMSRTSGTNYAVGLDSGKNKLVVGTFTAFARAVNGQGLVKNSGKITFQVQDCS